MGLLTVVAVWAAASLPLALTVGRALRHAGRRQGVADEAESYLRHLGRPAS
jgi:hypothetical protein